MSCCVVLWNYTNVSEKLASIITYTDAAGSRFFLNVALLLAEYLEVAFQKTTFSKFFKNTCFVFSVMLGMETMI
jgi:hypothetical protein